MAQHLEVERKYAVPPEVELPELGPGVAGVREHELEAVYLDTADHALLQRGITLRRRTGGPDAGWHLKTPAGADSRSETQHPAGPGEDPPCELPAALRDAVRAFVGSRPLRPVALVRNRRRELLLVDDAGRDLATVCDDRVTATAQPGAQDAVWERWREWEVELADGRPAEVLEPIEARLLAAGAERAGTTSKLARVLGWPGPLTPAP